MSRTVHHLPSAQWSVRETCIDPYTGGYDHQDRWASIPVAHVLRDLRFYAGCKRTPVELTHRTPSWGGWPYSWSHGGTSAVGGWARADRRRTRNWERMFNQDIAKLARAGSDLDDVLEPEGRTRHGALWDAW